MTLTPGPGPPGPPNFLGATVSPKPSSCRRLHGEVWLAGGYLRGWQVDSGQVTGKEDIHPLFSPGFLSRSFSFFNEEDLR